MDAGDWKEDGKVEESDVEETDRDYEEFKRIHEKDKGKNKRTRKSRRDSKLLEETSESVTSEKVKVIVRSRPMSDKEKLQGHTSIVQVSQDGKALEVHRPNPASSNLVNAKIDKMFTFDAVYDERTSQSELYQQAFKSLVDSVLEGFNGTIFAYGQTGSGKTYTMEGLRDVREHHGVIPHAFRHIFERISSSPHLTYLVSASYLEIYQEEVKDLLSPKLRICDLKENSSGTVYVKGLTTFLCRDFDEINALMTTGNKNRSVGATNMNEHSSRSHAVFMISVEMSEEWENGETHVKVGHLNLVDLAGSERQTKTGAEGVRLKEAVKINLSLSALGNVISALADSKQAHVPYRDSKLTRLLQNSLGGNSRTVMVATIGPASFNYDETIVTLRYASRAKKIKNKPKINEDPKDAMLRNYQQEIAKLRALLESKLRLPDDSGSDSGRRKSSARPARFFDSVLRAELEPYFENGLQTQDPAQVLQILAQKRTELLSDTVTVTEEKERLIAKLESTHHKVEQAEEECTELHDRLSWLQSKVLNGDKNLVEHTNEQQRLIAQRQIEIDQEKLNEDAIRHKISEHDLSFGELRDIATGLEAQIQYDSKKSAKLESRANKTMAEREGRAEQHGCDIGRLRRYLVVNKKDASLCRSVLENFVPPKTHAVLSSLVCHHDGDTFTFAPMTSVTLARPKVNRSKCLPAYLKSFDGRVLPRANVYYADENLLQLQPSPRIHVTRHYVPPETDPHLKSVMERALAEAEKDVIIDCAQGVKRRVKTARVRLGEVVSFGNNRSVRQVLSAQHRSKEIPYKDFVAVKRLSSNDNDVRPFDKRGVKPQLRRVNHVSLSPDCTLNPDPHLEAIHPLLHSRHCSTPRRMRTVDNQITARLEHLDNVSLAITQNDDEHALLRMNADRRLMQIRMREPFPLRDSSPQPQQHFRSSPAPQPPPSTAIHPSVNLDWVQDLTVIQGDKGVKVKGQDTLPFREARHIGTPLKEYPLRDEIRAHTNSYAPCRPEPWNLPLSKGQGRVTGAIKTAHDPFHSYAQPSSCYHF